MKSSTRIEPGSTNGKFKRKDGKLTSYAFFCGYVEEFLNDRIWIRLYREHGSAPYHVKVFSNIAREIVSWECFETVAAARKFFNQQKRERR